MLVCDFVSASLWVFIVTSCRGVRAFMRVIAYFESSLNLWFDIMGNEGFDGLLRFELFRH